MKPEEYKLLQETAMKTDELSKKLDRFLDLYYRTNQIDQTVFNNPVVLNSDLILGINGTRFGRAITNKLSFYGVTPVDQPATVSDPSGGVTVDSSARTAINAIIDRLQELGLIG